uniref:Ig-like domain-containing protein n=1 Tax=Salarias fasciatus TaxID=181472 RepID=A0A672FP50_SALFA
RRLVLTLKFWGFFISFFPASVQSNITAAEGSHALLPCKADLKQGELEAVIWSKFDRPGSVVTIFAFTDGHKNSGDRVALQDEHMKDGNFNITMKNVTLSDSGTYTCDVVQVDINDKATKIKTSSSVSLSVVPPGESLRWSSCWFLRSCCWTETSRTERIDIMV